MKKLLKWFAIIFGGMLIIALLILIYFRINFERKSVKQYSKVEEKLTYSSDSLVLAKGRHIAEVSCQHCHGEHLEGTVFFNDPKLGSILAPNLTTGQGGIGSAYTDADYVQAIRYGIRPNGNPLLIMPSLEFNHLTDDDLAAVISYIRQVPPVNNNLPPTNLKLMTKILMGAGMFGDIYGAELIRHERYDRKEPVREITKEFGDYMASTNGCKSCHGVDLGGGHSPDPAAPPAPNLTVGSISIWKEADFIHALRTGERPGGVPKLSLFMPWNTLGRMNDTELKAIWAYIQSIPKVAPKAD